MYLEQNVLLIIFATGLVFCRHNCFYHARRDKWHRMAKNEIKWFKMAKNGQNILNGEKDGNQTQNICEP